MSELNGGTGENENRRRLDQMNDVIQNIIALTLEQGKMNDRRHEQTMEELRELMFLQKEQRIDIMALFQGNKGLREAMEEFFRRHP
jgi:replicative DNA helicase